jgi:hypothetical protein
MAASKDLLEALIECKKVFKHQGTKRSLQK